MILRFIYVGGKFRHVESERILVNRRKGCVDGDLFIATCLIVDPT
jgi:hypothetical protein